MPKFDSIEDLQNKLKDQSYISDRGLTTAIFLSARLQRPLFLEGPSGVGKTEVAKVIANLYPTELIRLQCYEGLDVHHAIYEWNYSRQMLNIRLMESQDKKITEEELFSEDYLLRRPLLQALDHHGEFPPVLLIDEIDRSDTEFEAFLLEILSDYQITIPEIGTIKAKTPPIVIITSNRTREIHDALKRRCLYHWIDYPSFEKELEIVLARSTKTNKALAQMATAFMQELRKVDLYKIPGIAETLDWINALNNLDANDLDAQLVEDTLGVILKYQDDIENISGEPIQQIIKRISS